MNRTEYDAGKRSKIWWEECLWVWTITKLKVSVEDEYAGRCVFFAFSSWQRWDSTPCRSMAVKRLKREKSFPSNLVNLKTHAVKHERLHVPILRIVLYHIFLWRQEITAIKISNRDIDIREFGRTYLTLMSQCSTAFYVGTISWEKYAQQQQNEGDRCCLGVLEYIMINISQARASLWAIWCVPVVLLEGGNCNFRAPSKRAQFSVHSGIVILPVPDMGWHLAWG